MTLVFLATPILHHCAENNGRPDAIQSSECVEEQQGTLEYASVIEQDEAYNASRSHKTCVLVTEMCRPPWKTFQMLADARSPIRRVQERTAQRALGLALPTGRPRSQDAFQLSCPRRLVSFLRNTEEQLLDALMPQMVDEFVAIRECERFAPERNSRSVGTAELSAVRSRPAFAGDRTMLESSVCYATMEGFGGWFRGDGANNVQHVEGSDTALSVLGLDCSESMAVGLVDSDASDICV